MTNKRRNLGVRIVTPGGDNPLFLDLVAPGPYFRGVATSGIRFVGKGGVPPYAISIISTSSNSLPPGLSIMNPLTGDVAGTPTQAGRFSFIAEIADSAAATFLRSFTIEIKAQLFWQGPPPPIGEITIAYRYQFRVLDGSGNLLTSGFTSTGTLPAGLSLSAAGLLSGTPALPAGISYFTVHATDGTDSIDIPIALEIVEAVGGYYLEDRDPPPGWGGGAGSWLPSMVRLQDWIAHLVITGGVEPYSLAPSTLNPPPTGIKVIANQRVVAGRTSDAASTTTPVLMSVIVTDALGGSKAIQRAVFIIDSQQGRITPQHEGVDVAGGDGFTVLDFKAAPGGTVDVTNDGYVTTVMIGATVEGSVATVNDVAPDSAGNLQIGGVFTDSNGDLFVPDYVREVTSASPGTIDVDNSDPQHPVLDHQTSGVVQGVYGTASKVPRIGITDEGHIYVVSEQTITAGGSANAGMMYFGSGIDGDYVLDGTNTYAALSKSGSVYTAQQDIYANNMSFGGTGQLVLNGARLFVYGTLDVSGTSAQPAVAWDANVGGTAVGAGGAGGANASPAGASQTGSGGNGGAGGAGTTAGGNNGSAGGVNASLARNNGGRGGGTSVITNSGGSGSAGTGGNSIANTAPNTFPYYLPLPDLLIKTAISTTTTFGGGSGGSGGGGGGGSGGGSGGGGGGGGGGGNVGYVAARFILVTNGLSGVISCRGGLGGNGFSTAANNNGGGGGGCGGGGGVLHLINQALTGTPGAAMTVVASGGTAGNGGTHAGGTATDGKGGVGGAGGLINFFNVSAGTVTTVDQRGTPGSANTGTTGGAGTTTSLTLTAP